MIEKSSLSKQTSCKIFEVSKSAYYKYKDSDPQRENNTELLAAMRQICKDFVKYGYRRVTKALQRDGWIVNHKKVRRLMKENNLLIKRKKFKPKTTNSKHMLKRYPNLVRDLVVCEANQVWVVDITYIEVDGVFYYLAHIMDLYSRKIVGWELSRRMNTELTLSALRKAVALRGDVKGCIHHSDHGSQYLANDYMAKLFELGIRPSMGEVGNSYDNAFAESLNKTIKNEEVWINEYLTFEDAYDALENYIEKYNAKRLHSSIGYVPPNEFEAQQLNMAEDL